MTGNYFLQPFGAQQQLRILRSRTAEMIY